MASIEGLAANFRRLDQFARADTAIHRLDARAKVVATLAFIVVVASFDRYTVAALLPFFIFPIVLAALGKLPTAYVAGNVAVAIPFALAIGLFNPLFDQQVLFKLGAIPISAGWISCASIVVRAMLTLSAALILIGVTGFPTVCEALERLGMPRVLAMQMQFLYRYLFVLIEDARRSVRALELRSCGRSPHLPTVASLIGFLLLRTWQRADRIHMAMLARAYRGDFHSRKVGNFGSGEVAFVAGWLLLFGLLRAYDASQLLGVLVGRVLP
ncbi:MAG: cobalt ECF transporter T component CbiQ [Candidatus Accumulibacter sp.]|uniref:cobalt ECF transporter T component CbiQ n=1 Tax=Accumulibacter sp. TaxID=2053492 RepID=UPI002590C042|nr:cobalt ECF transporter T component CbiQ [Accumulibacter sp.]MCM8620239.1 cobalt ECF transporter T component CbiQ [Accumulibacter sp.]